MFKQLLKNYQIITALEQKDKSYQCAVILHYTGTAGIKIYTGLEFAPAGPGNNIADDNEDIMHYHRDVRQVYHWRDK